MQILAAMQKTSLCMKINHLLLSRSSFLPLKFVLFLPLLKVRSLSLQIIVTFLIINE